MVHGASGRQDVSWGTAGMVAGVAALRARRTADEEAPAITEATLTGDEPCVLEAGA